MGALRGITVVDCSRGPAAALATMILSEHGARVIRIIETDDDLHRTGGYVVWDRGKRVVRFDLAALLQDSAAAGTPRSNWEALLRQSDILLDDFSPGDSRQSLFDWERLQNINPRLIHCSITGFGKSGPLKDAPPIEDLVLARMGVLGGMPGYRPAPVHIVHPLPTVGAALFANIGIAAALLAREKTGRGRALETSLMAGALLYHPKVVGEHIPRHVFQTHPAGSAPYYSVYQCRDGLWLQFGCVRPGFVEAAAKIMGIGDLVAEPRFAGGPNGMAPEDERELRDKIATVMQTRDYAEWAALFEAADVPFAPSRLTEESLTDPQIVHNRMIQTLDDPILGPVKQMGVALNFSRTAGEIQGPRAKNLSAIEDVLSPDTTSSETSQAEASPNDDAPPLAGVRILEITNLIAGPTGGRLLADLGADVIKLEPPGGDLSRPIGRTYFYNVNFNKRSLALNTSTREGKEVVQKLAHTADALLANLRPNATERMGISAATHPNLIETHLTGYGWTGPYAHRPGIDPLAQSLMGMERAQGGHDNPPVFPAELAPTDYTTGAMGAFGTILALYQRTRHGIVQRVESNLLNGGALLTSAWFVDYPGKPERPLADRQQFGLSPFHRLYETDDGFIYVAADDRAAQHALYAATGQETTDRDALAKAYRGHPNESPLAAAMENVFAGWTCRQALAAMQSAGVPAIDATGGDSEIFLNDPHAIQNGMVRSCEHPKAGKMQVAWRYIQFIGGVLSAGHPTPLLGQHTTEILQELQYSETEIAGFFNDGVAIAEEMDG